ncbi:MAG: PDZ domain-containing protein [bacterium JZ-2024 1]
MKKEVDYMKKAKWMGLSGLLLLASFLRDPGYPTYPGRSQFSFLLPGRERAYLGVILRELSESEWKELGKEQRCCVVVTEVDPSSPAEKAGIRVGDVIVAVNGTPVENVSHFQRLIIERKPGDTISLEVQRKKEKLTLQATLSESPLTFPPYLPFRFRPYRGMFKDPGLRLYYLTRGLKKFFGVPNGVLVAEVLPGGAGARAGLKAGDIILRVDNQDVYDPSQFYTLLETSPVHLLSVNRKGFTLTINLTLDFTPKYLPPSPYEWWYPYPYPYLYDFPLLKSPEYDP